MKVGYVRVSSESQNTARQEVMMKELQVEEVYIDKLSGKDTNRPRLQAMIDFVRTGDIVIVESISRFARNTKDLLELVETLNNKKVEFVSKKENIDTTTPTGKFMLTIFGAVAEMEREYLKDRQKEGIAIAKQNGVYKGRKRIESSKFSTIYDDWKAERITAVRAMELLKMTKSTFYRRVSEFEKSKQNNYNESLRDS